MKFSLRVKISLLLLMIISIPLTITGVLSYRSASDALQETIEQQLQDTTASAASSIDSALESASHYLQIASKDNVLTRFSENPADTQLKKSAFDYIASFQKDNAGTFETLLIVNMDGQALLMNNSESPSLNVKDREYFQTAVKGTEAVSGVITSKDSGKQVVAVAQPLIIDGNTRGVLIGTLIFDSIAKAAAEVKVGETGYAYMIDRTGLIVYHPVKEKILKENIDGNSNQQLNAYVQKMKAGETSHGFYTYEGTYKFMSFQPAGNWVVATTVNYNDYMAPAINIRNKTIWITALFIVAALVVAYFFTSKNIINPIQKLRKAMALAGDGDLTVHTSIKSRDELRELSDSFNTMIVKQGDVIEKIRSNSVLLVAMSEEMAASSEEISASIEEISSSTHEIAAGAENNNMSVLNASQVLVQLSSLVQLAQNKAAATANNANISHQAAQSGRAKIINTVEAMDTISSSTRETGSILQSINEMSGKVSTIVATINDLAGQTNLLALNAAIEAARAGEEGRGFSVVAGEVRKLADQSHRRADEITELVQNMVSKIEMAVISMQGASEAVNEGVKVVQETDHAFIHIIESAEMIANNVQEILEITKDEVATSDQIVKLIDNMGTTSEIAAANSENVSSAVEEQAATVNHFAASAQEVSAMANELETSVENFIIRGDNRG
ncbi:methyl-accepting chemotaxis protein [Paenibacillus sp. sgz500958]|uniref:methyl-accepting chemotaxis protein n=1 Tax=Paenibacillus sp. sgz500958 TaxID=3242475 RepID=UPI0036D357FC